MIRISDLERGAGSVTQLEIVPPEAGRGVVYEPVDLYGQVVIVADVISQGIRKRAFF